MKLEHSLWAFYTMLPENGMGLFLNLHRAQLRYNILIWYHKRWWNALLSNGTVD